MGGLEPGFCPGSLFSDCWKRVFLLHSLHQFLLIPPSWCPLRLMNDCAIDTYNIAPNQPPETVIKVQSNQFLHFRSKSTPSAITKILSFRLSTTCAKIFDFPCAHINDKTHYKYASGFHTYLNRGFHKSPPHCMAAIQSPLLLQSHNSYPCPE